MEYEGKRCALKVGHHGHSNLVLSIQRFFLYIVSIRLCWRSMTQKRYRTYIKDYIEAKEKLHSK